MRIADLLAARVSQELVSVPTDIPVAELANVLVEHQIGAVPVIEDGRLKGIVSERDIVRAVTVHGPQFPSLRVWDIMTRKVITCTPDDPVLDTLMIMRRKHIRHIPVMKDDHVVALVSIREFDHAYLRLEALSQTDELTGLANRRHFMTLLDREIARHQRDGRDFSLAMLDIDHFKNINDTFGHEAGDRVLCAIARCLIETLRTYDGVGRIGGEEFAILMPGCDSASAYAACSRILHALSSREIEIDGGSVRVTASIGFCHASEGLPLMDAADKRLYIAKESGRNRIVPDLVNEVAESDLPLSRPALSGRKKSAGARARG